MRLKLLLPFIIAGAMLTTSSFSESVVIKKKKTATSPMLEKPFNVKMNVLALGFRNVSLFGEYAFHEKMSVQLGLRFMIPYAPSLIAGDATSGIANFSMGGFAVTPEFRFYPGKHEKAPAPNGFYIGLYGRYSRFNMNFDYNIASALPIGTNIIDPIIKNNVSLGQIGGGFIMGRQWAIKAFSIDWFILAGGVSMSTLSYSMKHPTLQDPLLGPIVYDSFSNEISDGQAGNYISSNYNQSSGTITLSASGIIPNVRSILFGGLCFGYHF